MRGRSMRRAVSGDLPSPLRGGARGGGRADKRRMKGVEHRIHVQHHFIVGEAQNTEALAFEIGCAPVVICDGSICSVLAAIDFDDEPSTEAAEIGNVGTKWDLPTKVRLVQRQPIPQMPPQTLFRFSELAPQPCRIGLRS